MPSNFSRSKLFRCFFSATLAMVYAGAAWGQSAPVVVTVAAFNLAWAGTLSDFQQHLNVCSAVDVNWCDTRAWIVRGATAPTEEEKLRAEQCQQATYSAAGGKLASMLIAPCNAYRNGSPLKPGEPRPDPQMVRSAAAYAEKLVGLRATVEGLVANEGVRVLAFQEVRSAEVVRLILGLYAHRFDTCEAHYNAFQSLAFAWDKSLTSRPGQCTTRSDLALKDPINDPNAFRSVRPGLALELQVNGRAVTFMNVHLKAACASVTNSDARYPGHLLTDEVEPCRVLNRQVPILEDWIESVAQRSPRFVLMGDFNRRIDDEAVLSPPRDQVRSDGSDPAGPNPVDATGGVKSRYLWQEISDGSPDLHQVPLTRLDVACTGFTGLDHIVISGALKEANSGTIESRKLAVVSRPDQSIETSDHCPRLARLNL
jgi:endonuclease/exonuclease/phosphatase family metal-dependent hydrolase